METVKSAFEYIKAFLKWVIISVIIGGISGIVGSVFHIAVDLATEFRTESPWIILFLPLAGLLIIFIYSLAKNQGAIDTNRVLEAVKSDEKVPIVMAPLIFISTVITHLFGGSAGREGAALQLGGSIGYNAGKLLKLNKYDMHIIVMSGMSGVFAALFGTPLTAAVFALEVVFVGVIFHAGLVPSVISAITAYGVAGLFGISPVRFAVNTVTLTPFTFGKTLVLALLCALVSILFCKTIHFTEKLGEKYLKNKYLRTFTGGIIIVLATLFLNTYDYNGAGMDVIARALSGEARPEAFIIKILFTAVTIAAGFKGGEIVPSFFIGSTFGCVAGSILGLDPSFSAAAGFVALFCGAVNCPIASLILALEVFGQDSILLLAPVCAVSYMMSGCSGLYKSQRFMYSKLDAHVLKEKK